MLERESGCLDLQGFVTVAKRSQSPEGQFARVLLV